MGHGVGVILRRAPWSEENGMSEATHQTGTLTFEQVAEVIDRIRPAVQRDGGDIELPAVEGNNARIRLVGHCVGCPSSMVTLQALASRRCCEQSFQNLVGSSLTCRDSARIIRCLNSTF